MAYVEYSMFKTDPANEVEGEMTVVKEDTISQLGMLLLITTLLN